MINVIRLGMLVILYGFIISLTGCSFNNTEEVSEAPYEYNVFHLSQADLEPTDEQDYQVVINADIQPEEKSLIAMANYLLQHDPKHDEIDTLFFYLPDQLVPIGSYAYAEIKDNKVDSVKINGERALICSDWHPYIKAGDRRCDIIEAEFPAKMGNYRAPSFDTDSNDEASESEVTDEAVASSDENAPAEPAKAVQPKKESPEDTLPTEG